MAIFVLLRIFCAHILADFFLQTKTWIDHKRSGAWSPYLYVHAFVVGVLTYLFVGHWTAWKLPLFIMITHFFIDWWKSTRQDTIGFFCADQLAHMLMIIIGWALFTAPTLGMYIPHYVFSLHFWILLTAYLLALRPVGFFIQKLTNRWQGDLMASEENETRAGLQNAGQWIGYMERLIILTFILLHQFGAIGFLIAAKSIFRFQGGVKNQQNRKHAEYILIGTLTSFFAAVIIGLAAHFLLRF